jgi:hypothetical protein
VNISVLKDPRAINRLQFSLREMPHATIETNRTCNVRCSRCYNLEHESIKSISEIRHEIEQVSGMRNLQTITILGGEPTLHPNLAEVVSYIKKKGLLCQILTNVLIFLGEGGDQYLDLLIKSGVDRITLHVDLGQRHVRGDIEKTRRSLFSMMERSRIHFSLSITIQGEECGAIPAIVRSAAKYRYFDGVLAVLGRDPLDVEHGGPRLENEYASIAGGLSIEPTSYIPSNLSNQDVRWLIYYYYINARTGKAVAMPVVVDRWYRVLYRLASSRHLFILTLYPAWTTLAFFASVLADIVTGNFRRTGNFLRCARDSELMRLIRLHYIAIQVPPELDEPSNMLIVCHHCPDATIRNGTLMPVCLADFISPLAGQAAGTAIGADKIEKVVEHLADESLP